jgi:hypothetical protein
MHSLQKIGALAWASLVATVGCARARTHADSPAGWQVVTPATNRFSSEAECANRSRTEWQVALDSDGTTPRITPVENRLRPGEVRVPGGQLVGVDLGEFGGRLAWVPDGGPAMQIYSENIQAIAEVDGRYYAFGGVAHRSTNSGRMFRVERDDTGRWHVTPIATLSGAPAAVASMGGDSLLVLTSGALDVVHTDGAHRVVHRNPVWSSLYPTSVVITRDRIVYAGMRYAVARLMPAGAGYTERWLVRAPCPE